MPSILQSDIQPHQAAAKLLGLVHQTRVEDICWYLQLAEHWRRVADEGDQIGSLKYETEIALEYAEIRILSKIA